MLQDRDSDKALFEGECVSARGPKDTFDGSSQGVK